MNGTLTEEKGKNFSTFTYELPFAVRELGDCEVRFFFDPGQYVVDPEELGFILEEVARNATGICGIDLTHANFGEIIIHLNPIVSSAGDLDFLKEAMFIYFRDLNIPVM